MHTLMLTARGVFLCLPVIHFKIIVLPCYFHIGNVLKCVTENINVELTKFTCILKYSFVI